MRERHGALRCQCRGGNPKRGLHTAPVLSGFALKRCCKSLEVCVRATQAEIRLILEVPMSDDLMAEVVFDHRKQAHLGPF